MRNSEAVATRVKHMVTWRLVAELMRRHKQSLDLTVTERDASEGDGLTLHRGGEASAWPGASVGELVGFHSLQGCPEGAPGLEAGGGYVWPWLTADDPKELVDAVEDALALPPGRELPPAASPVIGFRFMAELLGLSLLTRSSLQWRCAWSGGATRPEALAHPHLLEVTAPNGEPRELARLWMLVPWPGPRRHDKPVLAMIDLRGRCWAGKGLTHEIDLVKVYEQRRSMMEAAAALWAGWLRP